MGRLCRSRHHTQGGHSYLRRREQRPGKGGREGGRNEGGMKEECRAERRNEGACGSAPDTTTACTAQTAVLPYCRTYSTKVEDTLQTHKSCGEARGNDRIVRKDVLNQRLANRNNDKAAAGIPKDHRRCEHKLRVKCVSGSESNKLYESDCQTK